MSSNKRKCDDNTDFQEPPIVIQKVHVPEFVRFQELDPVKHSRKQEVKLRGCVVSNPTYKTFPSGSSVGEVVLADEEGENIVVSGWSTTATRYFRDQPIVLAKGKFVELSNVLVVAASDYHKRNVCPHPFEIKLDMEAVIRELESFSIDPYKPVTYVDSFLSMQQIHHENQSVAAESVKKFNLLGIVLARGDIQNRKTKRGTTIPFSEVILGDTTMFRVTYAIWGKDANEQNIMVGDIMELRNCTTNTFRELLTPQTYNFSVVPDELVTSNAQIIQLRQQRHSINLNQMRFSPLTPNTTEQQQQQTTTLGPQDGTSVFHFDDPKSVSNAGSTTISQLRGWKQQLSSLLPELLNGEAPFTDVKLKEKFLRNHPEVVKLWQNVAPGATTVTPQYLRFPALVCNIRDSTARMEGDTNVRIRPLIEPVCTNPEHDMRRPPFLMRSKGNAKSWECGKCGQQREAFEYGYRAVVTVADTESFGLTTFSLQSILPKKWTANELFLSVCRELEHRDTMTLAEINPEWRVTYNEHIVAAANSLLTESNTQFVTMKVKVDIDTYGSDGLNVMLLGSSLFL